jgi:hypothetical protein
MSDRGWWTSWQDRHNSFLLIAFNKSLFLHELAEQLNSSKYGLLRQFQRNYVTYYSCYYYFVFAMACPSGFSFAVLRDQLIQKQNQRQRVRNLGWICS